MNSGSGSGNADLAGAGPEVFVLTDEQILGIEAEGPEVESSPRGEQGERGGSEGKGTFDGKSAQPPRESGSGQAGMAVPQEAPGWLVERMRDPWVGDEARELWEGAQKAQREAAAFREAFGTPEDARALKEIYPGGVAEARSAAERARELAEIDAVFFGAPGKPAEELRGARVQLVERLYAQDPGAFREVVEAGVRLLGAAGGRLRDGREVSQDVATLPRSLHSVAGAQDNGAQEKAGHSGRDDRLGAGEVDTNPLSGSARGVDPGAQAGVPVPQEMVSRYREFERAANAELERSVGGAIGRAMEAALPNLKWTGRAGSESGREGHGLPLQERLGAAVREDVETALRSDAALGEQVARVLNGRKLDEATRAQVVRLIDARAQQLVPGAVRRVVGSWTAATLGGKKAEPGGEEKKAVASARARNDGPGAPRDERAAVQDNGRKLTRGRVDYRRWSDEQILGM